jgi:hypothetical protein
MFRTIRVDSKLAEALEAVGTKRKFWFSKGTQLFKAEERGTGEDWAEKIVCELAGKIGLPHVVYELAEEYDGPTYRQPGVVCSHCAPPPLNLILGNQLLLARDPNYPGGIQRRYKVKEYTVTAVAECIEHLALPSAEWIANLPNDIGTARGVFVGYIMLDAWVANQDRHHQNWGAIRVPEQETMLLAPTFDHGASLARNLSDEERKNRLESRDMGRRLPNFAKRAVSRFCASPTDDRLLSTLDAFSRFAKIDPEAAWLWMERLARVTSDEIEFIVQEVPPNRMSEIAHVFTQELLVENQKRLLELPL